MSVSSPNAERYPRQRARKSSSTVTYAGVPWRSASARTSTSPSRSTPSCRSVPSGQICGSIAPRSAGGSGSRWLSGAVSPCIAPAGCALTACSHPLRRRDAEQLQTVGEDDPRRLDEPQPRAGQRRRRLVPQREHAAGVVEAVVGAGQLLEVTGDAVRLAQLRRAGDDARELAQRAEQVALAVVAEQRRVEVVAAVDAHLRGVAQQRRDPRVCVLHVEDRVVVRLPGDQLDVHRHRRVSGITRERVARGIDTYRIDELVEADDVAGPLGQPHLFTTAYELDQLSDQDLDVALWIVTRAGSDRLEPVDIAVVIRAQHVDAPVEAALALVDVVRRVRCEVGRLPVAADEHAVLVVAEVGRT